MATGNLDLLPSAMVREVVLNAQGRADGVILIDKTTGLEHRARGRVVVLAGGACETVRMLLNSKSALFPDGLANSSGKVGRYIMDTVGASLHGQIPLLENLPPLNEDGASGIHVYVPWWQYQEQRAGKLDFPRGYHIEFRSGRQMPDVGITGGLGALTEVTYGRTFKEQVRRYYGSFINFEGRGEMIPNEHSFCEIDPTVKDRWGIPVLRFSWKWSESELRQAAHMGRTFQALIEAMGGKVLPGSTGIERGGRIIHEVGGAIMGQSPATSVTNARSQTWDVPNLFIGDGAAFCSNADKNPTLTIMALAWRMADHIVEEMRRGDL